MVFLNKTNVGGQDYRLTTLFPIGACATPAGTEIKTCTFSDSFELEAGCSITVFFTYANTYGNGSTTYPKLSVNGVNYPLKYSTGDYAGADAWADGQIVQFMFDGTNFIIGSGSGSGAGASSVPLGTVIESPVNVCPSGYVPMGEQFDETVYPALYAMLGTNVTPYKKSSLTRAAPVQLSWTALNTERTITDDGELIVSFNTGRVDVYINDVRCGMSTDNSTTAFEVKKGDTIEFDNAGTTGSVYMVYFRQNTSYCFMKATSGLAESQQDYVLQALVEAGSYSTTEVATGKKWIDGKTIYRKCFVCSSSVTISADGWLNARSAFTGTEAIAQTISALIKMDIMLNSAYPFIICGALSSNPADIALYNPLSTAIPLTADSSILIIEYTKTTPST